MSKRSYSVGMKRIIAVALATMISGFLVVLLPTAPAQAYCRTGIPAVQGVSQHKLRADVCSQATHRAANTSFFFDVQCYGYAPRITLYPGQSSGCLQYMNYVWVRNSTQAWCKIAGTSDPFTLFWVAGGHPWNHWESVNCYIKVV